MKKIIISLAIIGVVVAITLGVTGAWWSDKAISRNASFQSGTMDLKLANFKYSDQLTDGPITETWDQDNMEPGGTVLDRSLFMRNVGSIDAHRMSFAVTNLSGDGDYKYGMAKRMRITKLDYGTSDGSNWNMKSLLTGGAGADLSNYVAPAIADCDVIVDNNDGNGSTPNTIQDGIDKAKTDSNGDGKIVVCVRPGVGYNGDVNVNKEVTLVAMDSPDSANPVTINGGITVASNNVTIKGFTIKGAKYGIDDTNGYTGLTIRGNKIVDYTTEGIIVRGNTSGNSSINIVNNDIEAVSGTPADNSEDAIYLRGAKKHWVKATVDHNTLKNNHYDKDAFSGSTWSTAVGLSIHQNCKVIATYNAIEYNDFGIVAQGRNSDYDSPIVAAHYNNIKNSKINDFFYEKQTIEDAGSFDATNNWWGTDGASVGAGDSTGLIEVGNHIDYENSAGGPFIGYINGVDSDNNGFADLYDFYLQKGQGINVNSGLNASQWGKLDMAVQLDGPTTGDEYQGKKFGMDMTVNMYQH